MGKNSSRWLPHWLLQRKNKEVGIERTTVNLFIGGDFYCTFRIKLRASAMSGCRADPPELSLAGKTSAVCSLCENTAGNGCRAGVTCETTSTDRC